MLRRALSLLLILAQAALHGQPLPTYYEAAQGKTGADLRLALHTIIRIHDALSYSGSPHPNTADALGILDEDAADTNNVICIYSGYSIAKTNIGSTSGTWNREHLWPQSYGTGDGPARTDLHHLRPEQANVNSSRGNNYYDWSDSSAASYRTFTNVTAGMVWSRTEPTWEPPDSVKGDVARALLYMTVRYTGDAPDEPKLTLTDSPSEIVSGSTFMGRYTTLLRWHFADPVSAAERARNDGVAAYQGNRNPFIDNPEWVSSAFIPRASITLTGTDVTLWWTNDYAPRLVAEHSTNVTSAWLPVSDTAVLTTTNTWVLPLPLEAGNHFYRLRLE